MYFYSMQFLYLNTNLKCALRKCQSVTVKIVTLQLLLHQVAGVRVCHFFVLFCLYPSWGGTRWNGTKKQRWHFINGNLFPTLCCGYTNRISGIAVLNPLMKRYSCDIQNVNFRNFL